jgi:hypothetical protein
VARGRAFCRLWHDEEDENYESDEDEDADGGRRFEFLKGNFEMERIYM